MMPKEAWCGVKPSVEYLRVFGCIAHAHVPDARRTKLEDKSHCSVLLRVSEKSKAYRLYNPISKRIIISWDVILEEEEQWNCERSFKDDISFDLEWEDGDGEEVEDSDDGSEEENIASLVRDESSDGNEEDEADPSMTPRVRRAPTYLNDFVSGDGLSDEGEEVVQFDGGIFISQVKYTMEVLRRFGMEHSNSVENSMVPGFKISKDENGIEMDGSFFKQLIGSMMYLTTTRPI
ncbi:hypothetical protein KIW84_063216 [Lathyrus oleraceus]|uniref:Retroviral polymerase SH3-like domain-containing protein n=1 Tax=Pisum sativum TaxID=3888 RepID=A0A9D5A6I3_PEA|nr:hypothetical protein KIW84_063216 [Pisum sativum]